MYFKTDMIKELGPRRFHLIAKVKYKGRIYKTERKAFQGAYSRAVSELSRLKIELRTRATKEAEDHARKYVYFSGLMDAFESVGKYPSRMDCCARKLRAEIGGLHIDNLETGMIRYFANLNNQRASGKKKDKNGNWQKSDRLYSNGTKNRILAIARMICRQAYRSGLIPSDPLKLVRPWPERPRNRILTADELGRLRKTISEREPWLLPAFDYSIRIPMRLGDLCSLTTDHLDIFNGVIRHTANKTGAQQVAPLPPDMAGYFKNLPKSQRFLFSRNGGPLGNIAKAWQRCMTAAGITGLRWHDLRHHACTWLANSVGLQTHHLMVIGGWKRREMIEVYHNVQADKTAQDVSGLLTTFFDAQNKKTVELKQQAS